MNGQKSNSKAGAPPVGSSLNDAEGNEDSDDDREDENDAPAGGATGGGHH